MKRRLTRVLLALCVLFVRLVCLLPLFVPALQMVFKIPLTALIFFFVGYPLGTFFMRKMITDAHKFSYSRALAHEVIRLTRILPALLPSAAAAGVWLYVFLGNGFNKSLKILKAVGSVFSGSYDVGAAVLFILLVVGTLLSAIFWQRGFPLDYTGSVEKAREMRKTGHGVTKCCAINALLFSIAPVFALAILFRYAAGQLTWGKGFMTLTMSAVKLLTRPAPIPSGTAVMLMVIMVFVYLPLFVVRKFNQARCCMGETNAD